MTRSRKLKECRIVEAQEKDLEGELSNPTNISKTQQQLEIHDPGDDVHENVQITDSCGSVRKRRGPTIARDVWSLPDGHMIVVDCNELSQPVNKAAGILSSWLGTVARNGTMCPLDFDDWRKLKRLHGDFIIGQVKLRFIFPENIIVDDWIFESLDQKWRGFKHALKAKYIPKDALDDTPGREVRKFRIIAKVPKHVEPTQWKNLVEYWFSEKSMKRSIAGKLAKQVSLDRGTNFHTTGAKSYARKRKEFRDDNGREAGKIEFYEITHTKQDKNDKENLMFINDISREKVETAKRLLEERVSEVGSSIDVENQVYDEVFGVHKYGVPKGYGLGARSAEYRGHRILRNMVDNEELQSLKLDMQQMKERMKDLMAQNEIFLTMLCQNMGGASMLNLLQNNSGFHSFPQDGSGSFLKFMQNPHG